MPLTPPRRLSMTEAHELLAKWFENEPQLAKYFRRLKEQLMKFPKEAFLFEVITSIFAGTLAEGMEVAYLTQPWIYVRIVENGVRYWWPVVSLKPLTPAAEEMLAQAQKGCW